MHKEMNLHEIHLATLELMKDFHLICEKCGVSYCLAYGTLLGCIRHDGFIPWDDDVDVWMLRDDYEKLLSFFKKDSFVIGNIKLCCRESTLYYDYPIARISDMDYKLLMHDSEKRKLPDMGVFIDIYPLDAFSNEVQFKKAYHDISKLNWQYAVYCNPDIGGPIKRIVKHISCVISMIKYRHVRSAIESRTDKIIKECSDKTGQYLGVPCWYTTGNKLLPQCCFEGLILHKFEQYRFYIPEHYDEILTAIYGDYMTPPPEDKRTQYHNYRIIKRRPAMKSQV